MKIIRYCVRMHNGDYMLQDFDDTTPHGNIVTLEKVKKINKLILKN